jgi:hypothetical protein
MGQGASHLDEDGGVEDLRPFQIGGVAEDVQARLVTRGRLDALAAQGGGEGGEQVRLDAGPRPLEGKPSVGGPVGLRA